MCEKCDKKINSYHINSAKKSNFGVILIQDYTRKCPYCFDGYRKSDIPWRRVTSPGE